jgi:crotonobetainyl-CoA:carnitine CoA-transferase CaiB-like acyl-CoA transferase
MIRTNNRDKSSLALDLRHPRGHEVARRLLARSDVVVENMRPGAMARLGLDAATMTNEFPRLVYLSITAFGCLGDDARPGLDIAAQAESGMMLATGDDGTDPTRVGFTVVDNATAYAATAAVLGALFRRATTGRGAIIDISLLEVAVHLQGTAWTQMFDSGDEPRRMSNGYPSAAPAADVIAVRDGWIVLSAYTPAHWSRLCVTLARPELEHDPKFATNEARVQHRVKLRAELSAALGDYDVAGAVRFLNERGIVAGAVRSYRQVADSEDAVALDLFPTTDTETGYRYPAAPFSVRDVESRKSRSAPALSAGSLEVLRDLDFTRKDIEEMVTTGVVVADPTADF